MIRYVKRQDLEVDKYNYCIENAIEPRIYAFSWYLDIVADHWDVLVSNDYEAVMPIPWKRKFFIKYVTQPLFCQQLGVFSSKHLNEYLFFSFIKSIPKKYLKINLFLNSANNFQDKSITKRVNHLLPLDKSYEELYKSFTKRRKRSIQKGLKNNLVIEEVSFPSILKIAKENYNYYKFSKIDYDKLLKLFVFLKMKKKAVLLGVRYKNELIGGTVFLLEGFKLVYLFSAMTTKGKQLQVPSLLLNSQIKKYESSNIVLDFEGSMVPGIADFFKSFGAKKEVYYYLSKNSLTL